MNTMLKKLNNKKSGKKGFTLMEMLIVVAIIAILVAIAIPTFNSALDSARVSADKANVRAWYAEEVIQAMSSDSYTLPSAYPAETDLQADGATVTVAGNSDLDTFAVTYDADGCDAVTFGG